MASVVPVVPPRSGTLGMSVIALDLAAPAVCASRLSQAQTLTVCKADGRVHAGPSCRPRPLPDRTAGRGGICTRCANQSRWSRPNSPASTRCRYRRWGGQGQEENGHKRAPAEHEDSGNRVRLPGRDDAMREAIAKPHRVDRGSRSGQASHNAILRLPCGLPT